MATLEEHGEFATKMAHDVPYILTNPSLTIDEVTVLLRLLEDHIREFANLVLRLREDDDTDETLLDLAVTINNLLDELGEAVANHELALHDKP